MDAIAEIKSRDLKKFLENLGFEFKKNLTLCPFHSDSVPSLAVDNKNGSYLWYCHSCEEGGSIIDFIMKQDGVSEGEAIKKLKAYYHIKDDKPKIVKKYAYKKEGKVHYVINRFSPKGFKADRIMKGIERIPYHYDDVKKASSVWLVEGEKDADNVRKLGITATTFPFGKGHWQPEFSKYFKGKIVYVCLDKGAEKEAEKRARDLIKTAKEVKIIELPELTTEGQDISDWIEMHDSKTNKELKERLEIIAEKTPVYGRKSRLIFLSDVKPEPITWFWYNRFPEGKLSLLVGDPDTGKGVLSAFMTGVFTKGKNWPDGERNDKSGSVIFMSTEDNIHDTIRPRMEAAGADLNRVAMLKVEELTMLNVVKELIESKKKMEDLGLVFIDSMNSYMGGTKGNDEISVRIALAPLIEFAGENKITIIGISHLNKDQAKKAIYRTTGSQAYVAIPRSVYAINRDKEDKEKKRRKFMPIKSNLAINPTSLAFKIEGPMGFPRIVFEPNPINADADDEFSTEEEKDNLAARDEAKQYCREALKNGGIPSAEFLEGAEELKISESTLKRAKKDIGVHSYQNLKDEGKWYTAIKGKE